MQPSTPPQAGVYDDEIDLVELFQGLWAEKILIGLITLGAAAIAAAYAFLSTPEYQVRSVLRPASVQHLDLLNGTGVISIGRDEALRRVGMGLESYDHRLAFFRANVDRFEALHQDNRTVEQTFDEFNRERLRMLVSDPKREEALSPFVGIEMTYPRGMDGVALLNGFVDYIIDAERERVLTELRALVANRLNQLEAKTSAALAGYQSEKASRVVRLQEADSLRRAELEDELQGLRALLQQMRSNRIEQIDEAITVAKSLGIRRPSSPGLMAALERQAAAGEVRFEVNNQQFPLYFLGSDALEAEREVLRNRQSDDFTEPRIAQIQKELRLLAVNRQIEILSAREEERLFLDELAGWQQEAARLRAIDIDPAHLQLVQIDQRAVEPVKAVKPRKALILALGVVLGGMAGLMAALVRRAMRNRRAAETSA